MCQHEDKYCPCCKQPFECKVGSILLCQCSQIKLTAAERDFIGEQYDDCLCSKCMLKMKERYHKNHFQDRLKKILGIFYRGD
ncbi:cysteine-rich CWC family protein [Niabella soli]|uniref:Cysteine-rich CWC n=1 Tax=Niabella soli DSM 19437 TaxID=929713 RepID=W0F3B1_9BACT|nr:cysteine-rich CWC family protein [Niabella soli]AHF16273.1 hypothetical protein NIASO_16180 [Niabella soli DSM 19437]